jgi:outer membrane protein assembly factor BamB
VNDRYLVQGLEREAARIAEARKLLSDRGESGPVTILHWDGKRLPYADNLVNLIIVEPGTHLNREEILRVLAPGGVARIGTDGAWKKLAKPWPEEIDEWTHFLHGTDNNAVADDTRIAPPRYLQWVSGPRWARSHDHLSSVSGAVSAAGRIFYIADEGPTVSVKAPPAWRLVARDAFNGVLLWKREIASWEDPLRPFRSGPAELPRRLVAVGERVYVTLGYGEPVVGLDAVTGETLRTYTGTEDTHEILVHGGKLFLVISDPLGEESPTTGRVLRRFAPWRDAYDEFVTRYPPKQVQVVDAASGKLLWKKDDSDVRGILPLTLLVSGDRLFYQNDTHVMALAADSGDELWRAERPAVRRRYAWLTPTLVLEDGVLLSADRAVEKPVDTGDTESAETEWRVSANHILEPGEILAFSAETGEKLWTAPCHEGFNSPVDVFVIDGKVWSSVLAWGRQPGLTDVLDLHTGEVTTKRSQDQKKYTLGFGHARCYRHKATTRYLLHGRAGIEFVDLSADRITADHWVRGACQYGILPCNGLIYAPSHSCACYITAKLSGFNALSGHRALPPREEPEVLEKGPAFKRAARAAEVREEPVDWPTYRQNAARGGTTPAALPGDLEKRWERSLRGPLTAVVVAGGRLYVAQREAHTVQALSALDGKPLWQYTAGGRVDSPPAVHGGRVYFGAADGWMYCLRAEDGALAWRFRVAPESRQIVSYGQLESAWPVHGTVLVCKGPDGGPATMAWAAAGRSSYVDGGVYLCGVNARTGEPVTRRRIAHRDPETGQEPQDTIRGVIMPGAMPDVLACDGSSIFMRHQRFDLEGKTLEQDVDHLYSSAGFLDDTWWHRTYLQFGREMKGGYGGWTAAGKTHVSGRVLVKQGNRAFGFGRKDYTRTGSHLGLQGEYHLYGAELMPAAPEEGRRGRRTGAPAPEVTYTWSRALPFLPRAMVLAGDSLVLAGPREVADFEAEEPRGEIPMWIVSADDGTTRVERHLAASPVHDSFAVADGRLYYTTVDGRVVCRE